MHQFYCRPRPRRRKILWRGWIDEVSFYALVTVVVLQGVRLLVRPTLIDGVVFIASVVVIVPRVC